MGCKRGNGRGIRIARVYYCPHSMADDCACRKPRGGMLLRAMGDAGVNALHTFLLGDTEADIQASQEAGCLGLAAGEGRFLEAVEQVLALLQNVETPATG